MHAPLQLQRFNSCGLLVLCFSGVLICAMCTNKQSASHKTNITIFIKTSRSFPSNPTTEKIKIKKKVPHVTPAAKGMSPPAILFLLVGGRLTAQRRRHRPARSLVTVAAAGKKNTAHVKDSDRLEKKWLNQDKSGQCKALQGSTLTLDIFRDPTFSPKERDIALRPFPKYKPSNFTFPHSINPPPPPSFAKVN